jgi:NAD(P)-dependent dehydrogenase (short-subunit alcohol dehydrogenase family)
VFLQLAWNFQIPGMAFFQSIFPGPNMNRLQDKICVITASTQGMGEGIGRMFASEGATVIISGRNADKGQALVQSIIADGGKAMFQKCDVTVEADCRGLIDAVVKAYGRVDVLVNNAGDSSRCTIEDCTTELWDHLFELNVRGAFVCSQQFFKYNKDRKAGAIVNIGSVNAYIGEPALLAYSASKGALMTFTKNLASYLGKYRIRVNQLNVGWTDTPNEHVVKTTIEGKGADWLEEAAKTRPFGRLLVPKDIAYAATYFASDESCCISGSVLDLEQHPVGAPPKL